ncbi:hypothetical protein DM02DRAFT_200621 [Periconia macrospinosa]|uniref:L-ornithine N(5)-monooxygenase [NAD(P)H] n=1 Tax=Periconia macrospinosa TaxID=97972 RepID=A0A2V1E4E1_9PLEO|nr:hypothetical protein DM02DRAFT_200621 [Periconia macrospinosa]
MYDLICIGFGPAQLATAIANREAQKPCDAVFIERKPAFSWHKTQLSRMRMENPFIFDLATTRNPRSGFTYSNFLLSRNRLIEFANSDRLNPLRMEFEEYLHWCADQFKDQVRYDSEAIQVTPEKVDGVVEHWNVVVKDDKGKSVKIQARNILAPSPAEKREQKPQPPSLPTTNFLAGQRIVAVEDYASRRNEIRDQREVPLNVALVGSGHQIVEVLDDLLSCPRLGNITVVSENESLAPLKSLSDGPEPPQPKLCSIWAKPTCEQKTSVSSASELIQHIYDRAYEKMVATKGKYCLRVVMGRDTAEPCSAADVIIAEQALRQLPRSGLFRDIDSLVLGCRQKGESLEEVQFKRGAVIESCRMWMVAGHSEGGRSLVKDISLQAGEVVNRVTTSASVTELKEHGQAGMAIAARM